MSVLKEEIHVTVMQHAWIQMEALSAHVTTGSLEMDTTALVSHI